MKQLLALLVAATFAAMSYTAVAQDKTGKSDKSSQMDKKSDKKAAKKSSKKSSKKAEKKSESK